MKTIYLDCGMGAAGDMLTAALLELHPDPRDFIERMNALNIPGVEIANEKAKKCGITGTHIRVTVNGNEEHQHEHRHEHECGHHHEHHHHSGMHDIEHVISGLDISEAVKKNVIEVYTLIAEAESHVHGTKIKDIHFHEVGTMDAVADVVGVCLLMEELAPDKVVCSPINVGSGTVKCAHGILPVPAPATAHILRGIPMYSSKIRSELCTPTGAALIKHFVSEFGDMPVMRASKIGCGMGTKDFEAANCIRAIMGETEDRTDEVYELRCNVDDMTGEQIGFATEMLMIGGALDVFTVPIGMKKNRPGILITCLCRASEKERIIGLMFKYTSTIGIREYAINRHVLERNTVTLHTGYGEVRAKVSAGCGVKRIKAEYEDLARIARENDMAISEIKQSVELQLSEKV